MFTASFWLYSAVTALAAYLVGSVSFAVIVSRICMQDDVRKHGSGNAGMTNMLRSYGKKMAALTAAGDFGKALVAVALGRLIMVHLASIDPRQFDGGYIAGLFVILGHLYPIFFGFKGGKGVLTSLGVVLMLNPIVFAIIGVICIPAVLIVKIVSLVALIGYTLFPFATLLVDYCMRGLRGGAVWFDFMFAFIISAIGIYMHRANIGRLRAGTEYRFGQKKPDASEQATAEEENNG